MALTFIDFDALAEGQRQTAARILREAFVHMDARPWQTPGEAEAEVATFSSDPDRFAIAALEDGVVAGWVGGIRTYDHGLELHPLAVDPPRQRLGVGRALVAALEDRARGMGVLTVYLGTDDDYGGTSLHGQDLFPGVAERIASMQDRAGHAFGFYRRCGYEVVGLLPDVNGFGKPDIFMAKRIGRPG